MYQLKFDEKRCLACPDGACLVQCQYLKYEADPARKEMVKIFRGEDSRYCRTVLPVMPARSTASGAIIPFT